MNAVPHSALLGRGLYPLGEAARLAQLPPQTARRWADGNAYRYRGESRSSAGLVRPELPPLQGIRDLTFPEMLTLRMVKAFRSTGLGLRTIKRVAEKAAQEYKSSTPLVSKRFRTDGRRIFVELQREAAVNDGPPAPKSERHLIDVLSGQVQFAQVVEPSLFQNLEWQDEWHAARWWPGGLAAGVVVDPAVIFGAPRLAETSIPTAVIAKAFAAEGGDKAATQAVAEWHGITAHQVEKAVAFETEWLKQAA